LLALKVTDIFDLYEEKFDAFDCPHCGARKSIIPSLASYFLVEDTLVLLDRGFDPEPAARKALAPLVTSLGAKLAPERVDNLTQFKDIFAAKVKAVARNYPYQEFIGDADRAKKDLANWRSLQGEVLSALYAGASGVVPRFDVQASDPEGRRENVEYTTSQIEELVLDLLTHWSLGLSVLSRTTPLEELLVRLIDSSGVVAFIADRVVEKLARNRPIIEQPKVDSWFRFHFNAVEASLYGMIGKENPNAPEWAREYLMVRCAVRDSIDGGEDRFLLGPKRVATTISYEDAFNAVASVASSLMAIKDKDERVREFEALDAAANDLGHEKLLSAVMEGLTIGTNSQSQDNQKADESEYTPESLASLILKIRAEKDFDQLELSAMLKVWRPSWFSAPEAVARLFDLLEPTAKADPEMRADLLTWFGERMKLLGAPKLALQRIGEEAAPWENGLSKAAQRALWTERSNAFRLAGERARALKVAEATLGVTLSDPEASESNKATALTNCGILLRENGRFVEAVQFLRRAAKLAPEARQWSPLHALASTYLKMGRMSDAAEALAIARKTAGGADLEDIRISLLVTEISVRIQLGQQDRVDELIRQCPAPEIMPDKALIGYVNVLRRAFQAQTNDEYRSRAVAVLARLESLVAAFEKVGNFVQGQASCHAAATLAHAFSLPEAEELWYRDAAISMEAGRLPDARTAIEVAICGIRDDAECFYDRVAMIPSAIAQQAASVSLDAETMGLLSPLEDPFNRLTLLTYESDLGPAAIQFLAEIRRNAHRKAVYSTSEENPGFSFGPSVAAAMPAHQDPFVVLEWCDIPEGMLGLITFVRKGDGQVQYMGKSADLDLLGTAERIRARLDNWHNGRSGQPYEAAQWELVKKGLRGIAATLLPDGGHIVIVDHPALSGLPFHIALVPEWTVSYAADWSAIEAAVKANGSAPSQPKLGVLHAPRSNETIAVREALHSSAVRMLRLANEKEFEFDQAEPGAADSEAFRRLLETTDLMKVLCHGQVTKEDHQVVLVIDHDHASPPGYSFGVTLETAQGHRFGRDQLAEQRVASSTIFLGACSAGVVSVGGLDERTSFASLLARAGTKSVVAPRWKIDAELALPVLDDALSRFVDGMSLAKAVSTAAEAAMQRGVPAWQAYAFVVEGAWV
jgi:tetratricopeptide (TPR) repeat protein